MLIRFFFIFSFGSLFPFPFFTFLPFYFFPFLPLNKSLLSERLHESGAHGFAVLLGISNVGKYLCQSLYLVGANKLLVLFECLFLGIEVINLLGGIVIEGFAVYDGTQWQTVGLCRLFVGPSNGKGGNRHDELGQM